MTQRIYRETFDEGPGGWIGWDGKVGPTRLEIDHGAAVSRSPWWVDFNHAPPGAGYLHILFALHLQHGPNFPQAILAAGGTNHYVQGGFPTNLTNARVTVRIRGELDAKGAQLVLLVQGNTSRDPARPNFVNQVLVGQPLTVTREWTEQTLRLIPDPSQWINLGTRHDRVGFYGTAPIDQLLRDVNCDIIFVLFPLDIVPAHPIEGDPHRLRAGHDYPVDLRRLPSGYVMLDDVQIEFP